MKDIKEVFKSLPLILNNAECFAWNDFKDRGSNCIDWFNLSVDEKKEYLITKANVELLMPKKSQLFYDMERSIAEITGNKWVTYDWTVKAVARAISFCNFREFYEMLTLSRMVKMGMKKRGLKQINSLSEAFA